MLNTDNRLPLAASIRLAPDDHNRQIILVKPDNRRVPFAGATRLQVRQDGLTPERVIAINRALAAEFVVTLTCADTDAAIDTYLDLCDLLAATRAAARSEREAERLARVAALRTAGASA